MNTFKKSLLISIFAIIGLSTSAQTYNLELYKNGVVSQSIPVERVDSIKVRQSLSTPQSVTAAINGQTIQVSWGSIEKASTYEVYRSSDNVSYSSIASGITGTSYIDNSPLSGMNYYKVQAHSSGDDDSSALSSPAMVNYTGTVVASGLYMGIIGFNDEIANKTKNISALNTSTKSGFTGFVSNLTTNNDGTVLYYAVDNAITKLSQTSLPTDLIKASIVTFTDGLDVGSTAISDYGTGSEYLSAIQNRLQSVRIQNNPITAYSIGFKGKDINSATEARFENNLKNLASKDENMYQTNTFSELNGIFQEIANQLITTTYNQTITLTTPAPEDGQKIRFTFDIADNTSGDAANSQMYIEGVYTKSDCSLKNVVYKGVQSSSGSTIVGEKSGLVKVKFTFEGFGKESGEVLDVKNTTILDFRYDAAFEVWQKNTEFSGSDNVTSTEHIKSAVVMLVLDCSGSMGSDFATLQTYANNFIETLVNGMQSSESGSGSGTGTGGGSSDTGSLNGHEYVDLGLPSGLKWATCNVGAASPEKDGDYFAWGETTTKSEYTSSNSATYGKSMTDISGNAAYDAARANWGGTWRLPTSAEIDELINNCTWTWTTQGGHKGYRVTGPNGNSIFLPAAGYRNESSLLYAGSYGSYWSSTPRESGTNSSYELCFDSGGRSRGSYSRYCGRSVRPVSD